MGWKDLGRCAAGALLVWGCLVPGGTARAEAATRVTVPLHLDYPLVEELLAKQLFTGPDGGRELLNDSTGCNSARLSEPRLAPQEDALRLVATLVARLGFGSAGNCVPLFTWQGRVGVVGEPVIETGGSALALQTRRIWLEDASGAEFTDPRLRELTDSGLRSLLGNFRLDLKPTLDSLGALLPEVLPRQNSEALRATLDSLALEQIEVTPDTLDVGIGFAVQPLPAAVAERALSPEELAALEQRWQMMDALMVLAVKYYAAATGLQPLRSELLEVLIESRYRLGDALTDAGDPEQDAVREWFLQSWQQLAPVVRAIALEQPGQQHLAFFTVITATDALAALDRLGPGFGLDVSADGLRRLARLINAGAADQLLEFDEAVDPELRRLLEEHLAPEAPPPAAWHLDFSLLPRAHAAGEDRLNSWIPSPEELPDYLPQVSALLERSAEQALGRGQLDAAQQRLFRALVLSAAWQESCWRQYVVEGNKRVPLRSSTGDVGIMQINERVWRGFYDLQRLRWDIAYNSDAGAEVLLDYLVKYALRKGEHQHPGGLDNLARASYSAYNGGPSKVSRYRQQKVSAYEKKVDTAFWDKYRQVAAGRELAVAACLGGEDPGPASGAAVAATPRAPPGPGPATPAAPRAMPAAKGGPDWLAGQNPAHFTLQLGAFSEEAFARTFLAEAKLGPLAQVHRRRIDGEVRFLVLYGSFPSRAVADNAARTLSRYQPWIRPFADLQQLAP